jgi:hypothetical protein
MRVDRVLGREIALCEKAIAGCEVTGGGCAVFHVVVPIVLCYAQRQVDLPLRIQYMLI